MSDPIIGTLVLPGGTVHSASAQIPAIGPEPSWARFKGQGGETLGIHVYARSSNALIAGTITITNGAINPDGSGFCGVVFFDSLTLKAPAGWEWVTLPQKGESVSGGEWKIATKPASGSHLFRAKAILQRPYVLVAVGNAAGKARAAAHLRFTTLALAPVVASYGPTMSAQPTVDRVAYQNEHGAAASQLLSAQEQGSTCWIDDIAQVEKPAMGPWWMDGQGEQGAPGGYKIHPSHGWEQCAAGVLVDAIMFRATLARQFCAVINAQTGKPMSLHDWTRIPERHHMYGEPGMEDVYEMDFFTDGNWRYKRFNAGNCAYGWDLARYQGIDMAHGIRLMRHAIPLIEYTGDRAVKDALLMAAESWRTMHWSDRSDERLTDPQNPGDWVSSSLTKALDDKTREPHRGGWFDRNYGWMCYAGAAVIKYASADVAAKWKPWGKKMLDTGHLAADKFGFTMREHRDELPHGVRGLITFHEGINAVGMFALDLQTNGASTPALGTLLKKKCKSAYVDLPPQVDEYNANVRGPFHWIGTEKDGQELNALAPQHCSGGGDPAHVLAACAFAYRASGDPEPLTWALKHLGPHATLQQRFAWCKTQRFSWTVEMEVALAKHLGL